jgi:hypothetical protein
MPPRVGGVGSFGPGRSCPLESSSRVMLSGPLSCSCASHFPWQAARPSGDVSSSTCSSSWSTQAQQHVRESTVLVSNESGGKCAAGEPPVARRAAGTRPGPRGLVAFGMRNVFLQTARAKTGLSLWSLRVPGPGHPAGRVSRSGQEPASRVTRPPLVLPTPLSASVPVSDIGMSNCQLPAWFYK